MARSPLQEALATLEIKIAEAELVLPEDDYARWEILAAIAHLPDEAFNYLVASIQIQAMAENSGFQADSEVGFQRLEAAIGHFLRKR